MRASIAFSVAAMAGLSAGQASIQNNYPYRIDPDSVSKSDRQTWCNNQVAQCPLICSQLPGVTSLTTVDNECDPDALTYSCVCENNVSPNITQYSQTLPFYICQEWGNQCVKGCNGDNTCSNSCRADHPCGAQSPYLGNTSIPSTSTARSTSSSTAKIPVTGFGGSSATATSSPGTGAAVGSFMPSAGMTLCALVSSVFLGFAVLL
ncbi:hypothetical protein EK21DRAFT_112372 [Setomelanomma holmii]|uniref:DUF7707 domain-containing protein n=1 Tax=Setomelanomma holmii TaxID=210430 RepID=A0A9P4HBH7_9PLEO|nr:hypothetical protein EK21DRAFT_112372 [Setomelanomma holmii]